jgi:hypothetical protein
MGINVCKATVYTENSTKNTLFLLVMRPPIKNLYHGRFIPGVPQLERQKADAGMQWNACSKK